MTSGERPSYAVARRRFVVAADAAGAACIAEYRNSGVGPGGEPLFVDLARLGAAGARRILVLVSGTHGVEGHCGSFIQSRLLETGQLSDLPAGVAVLLVHAINPHGFAWDRRVTEEGVDLNRNFVDFARPLPSNVGFDDELAALLTSDPGERHEPDVALAAWFERHGKGARAIVAGGQHTHPAAPFFGGHAPTWARTVFERIIADYMTDAERVCLIDYHTGLGSPGAGQLIGTTRASPAEIESALEVWGSAYVPAGGRGSVSYDFTGDLIGAARAALEGVEVLTAAHEFGTVDEGTVLGALRDDHGAKLRGGEVVAVEARRAILAAFFPADPAWTSAVEAGAFQAVTHATRWLRS